MNTNTIQAVRRSIAVAAIAVAVAFASGCGTETATAPSNISDPVAEQEQPQGPQCSGSPQYAEWACDGAAGTPGQDTPSLTPRQADAEGWIRGGGGGR